MGLLAALAICWPTQVAGADLSLQILYGLKSNPKNPRAELVQGSDGNFYGTTAFGGTGGENGTVFAITPAGVFAILHSFQGLDGALPWSSLVQGRDGLFYGTAQGGGTNGDFGTVFQIATNGDFTVLHYFGGSDGRYPQAPLRQDADGNFYGTTAFGGTNGDQGTVFKITPKGLFTSLFSFSGTNGRRPVAGLIQASDGNFYGTTAEGGLTYEGPGVLGQGTVFRMTPEGALTPLFSFSGPDGSGPTAGLVETSDGSFYGTTQGGGANGDNGTVFKITPGAGLSTLYSFAGPDGNYPVAGLTRGADGNFYGTTSGDRSFAGTNTFGTIFRITPEGRLTTLYSFNGTDGASPVAGLVPGNDGNFYGTTFEGGPGDGGTLFRLVKCPLITGVSASEENVTLAWTSFTNGSYRVEYKPVLTETTWTALSPDVIATNNKTVVTYLLAGTRQRFFRIRLLPP